MAATTIPYVQAQGSGCTTASDTRLLNVTETSDVVDGADVVGVLRGASSQALITKDSASRPLTVPEVFIHLFKGNVGPGVLALPLHFARVGPIRGVVITSIVALQGTYGMWVLVRAQETASRLKFLAANSTLAPLLGRPLTFEEVGSAAFGRSGRRLVATCVLALQLGVCSVIIGLLSTNLKSEVGDRLTRREAVAICYVPCAILSQLPDLSSLWPLSLLGNAAMLLALSSTVVAAVVQLMHSPPTPTRTSVSYNDLIACVSSAFYAFEGVALVLPVGNQLTHRDRARYPTILVASMTSVASCFLIVGATGGAAFSHDDSASITSFLERRFAGTPLSPYFHFINIAVAVAALATFPLQLTPAAQVIDLGCNLRTLPSRKLARFAVVTGCATLVAAVDTLDSLIDLIGGVANTLLAALPFTLHAGLLVRSRATQGSTLTSGDVISLIIDAAGIVLCLATLVLSSTASLFGN